MSKTQEDNSDDKKSRVQISNLQQRERDLKDREAESVKGGGGAMGGVDYRRGANRATEKTTIGEEIPS